MTEHQPEDQALTGMPDIEQEQRYKTLAVRVEEDLHAQLRFIAQLSGSSIADEIRTALRGRVLAAHNDPELLARAEAAHQEIEREAAARAAAIAGFIGKPALEATAESEAGVLKSRRGTRPNDRTGKA